MSAYESVTPMSPVPPPAPRPPGMSRWAAGFLVAGAVLVAAGSSVETWQYSESLEVLGDLMAEGVVRDDSAFEPFIMLYVMVSFCVVAGACIALAATAVGAARGGTRRGRVTARVLAGALLCCPAVTTRGQLSDLRPPTDPVHERMAALLPDWFIPAVVTLHGLALGCLLIGLILSLLPVRGRAVAEGG